MMLNTLDPKRKTLPKRVSGTTKSPILSVSLDTNPCIDPEPYWISKEESFLAYVDDFALSYLACNRQAIDLHCFDGIHKFDEPVSRITLNCCGGVPSPIFYSTALEHAGRKRPGKKEEKNTVKYCAPMNCFLVS